jgi:hypothetical protein
MEKYIKYTPLALFCLAAGKLLVLTPTWEGVASVLVAGLLTGLYEWKNHDKAIEAIEARLDAQTKASEERYEILANAINTHAKAFEDIKTHVSGLNLARNLKQSQAAAPTQKIF